MAGRTAYNTLINSKMNKTLLKKAENGDTDAMIAVGLAFLGKKLEGKSIVTGKSEAPDESDYSSGIEYLEKAASSGHVEAKRILGEIYFYGCSVKSSAGYRIRKKDFQKGFKLLAAAATKGNHAAAYILADWYSDGQQMDLRKAIKYYNIAEEYGEIAELYESFAENALNGLNEEDRIRYRRLSNRYYLKALKNNSIDMEDLLGRFSNLLGCGENDYCEIIAAEDDDGRNYFRDRASENFEFSFSILEAIRKYVRDRIIELKGMDI